MGYVCHPTVALFWMAKGTRLVIMWQF